MEAIKLSAFTYPCILAEFKRLVALVMFNTDIARNMHRSDGSPYM